MQYTSFWEISPWTIQAGGRLNVENFDIRGGYFWVWGNNWGQKKKKTQTADLHVNFDNKQVCHLRVMLHISSSIPCLLNWNFSSEDNPGKIEQKQKYQIVSWKEGWERSKIIVICFIFIFSAGALKYIAWDQKGEFASRHKCLKEGLLSDLASEWQKG